MKNLTGLLAILFMFSSPVVQAQLMDKSGLTFTVFGGVNFQNLNGKDANGDKYNNDLLVGFHVGAQVRIPIAPTFYFQPGLIYTTKGAKNSEGQVDYKYKLGYVELPLNLVYRGMLGGGHIFLGFGPYLAYGIDGKAISDNGNVTLKEDIEFQNTIEVGDDPFKTYFKPFDAGGNIFFGYEFANGIFAQFNAQLGMLNLHPEDKRIGDDDTTIKNTGFGLSAGYWF